MGINSSTPEVKSEEQIINHPKFGSAALAKDSENLVITLPVENDTDFYIWEKNINTLRQLDDQTYMLPKYYQYKDKPVCGQAGHLKLQFDNYPYILHDQIQNRRLYDKHFQQPQIWYLLYTLASSAYHFHKMNKNVGDIRPKNIFINDSGQIKVSTIYSWPNQINNVNKALHGKVATFVAPEQLDQMRVGKIEKIIDRKLAESFSVGLSVLNAGLLDRVQILYNTTIHKIDQTMFDKKLNKWMKLQFKNELNQISTYSNQLKQIVLALCEPDPRNRISCTDVYRWLNPCEQSIIDLRKFSIGAPPIKKQRLNPLMQHNLSNQRSISKQKLKVNERRHSYQRNHSNSRQRHSRNPRTSKPDQQTGYQKDFIIQRIDQNGSQSNARCFRPFEQKQVNPTVIRVPFRNANIDQQYPLRTTTQNIPQNQFRKDEFFRTTVQTRTTFMGNDNSRNVSNSVPKQAASLKKKRQDASIRTGDTYSSATENDLLKKIAQQLQRSQKMFP